MFVEVKSNDVRHREGMGKLSGKAYSFDEQRGWLFYGADYPKEVSWSLDAGQSPFAPGRYEVGPECFQIDGFGNLSIKFQRMKPARAAPQAARAAG